MAWSLVRCFAASIALALAGNVARAQNLPSIKSAKTKTETVERQNTRVVSLLEELADQARESDNLAFAVRAQSQAAALLWAQDAERARAIFRRAFQSLESEPTAPTKTDGRRAPIATLAADKRQLRTELLNQIAARDPQLAEDLARDLADSIED